MSKPLVKFVIGFIVIGGALVYLVINAMQSSWAYDISVDDFVAKSSETQTHSSRVGGVVGIGTISRNLEQMQLNFKLEGQDVSLPVSYQGTVPDNFGEEKEVLVEGRLDTNGVFQADRIITKCESKYKAKARGEDESESTSVHNEMEQ
ncbi:MAG: cytochrome c maturation protein CcmE [Sedimentisphaerales bacterium]|nr:cytochrome c maturation protein CcmE [Sedimentisphaerales bacterium]